MFTIKTINQEPIKTNIEPKIVVQADDFEDRNKQVVDIDVMRPDGSMARFWVGLEVKRGKPTLTINSAPGPKTYATPKDVRVTARWFTPSTKVTT